MMHMLAEKQVKKRLGPLLSGIQGEQQKAMSGPEKKAQKLRVSTTFTENWVQYPECIWVAQDFL